MFFSKQQYKTFSIHKTQLALSNSKNFACGMIFLALTGELWTALSQRDEETAQAAWSFCLEELQIVLLMNFLSNYFNQKN